MLQMEVVIPEKVYLYGPGLEYVCEESGLQHEGLFRGRKETAKVVVCEGELYEGAGGGVV